MAGRLWSAREDELMRQLYPENRRGRITNKELEDVFHRSFDAIHNRAHRLGLTGKPHDMIDEELLKLEVVDAPRGPTIADGVKLYDKPAWRQIKSIVYIIDDDEPIMAVLRGDLDVNEIKLKHVLKCDEMRQATDEEITKMGSAVGFVSPLKLKIRKIGDPSLKTVRNLYTGADAPQVDTLNVFNGNSPSNDVGLLTETRLKGLGMGGDAVVNGHPVNGGITYSGLEALNLDLGYGHNTLVIESTHEGSTTVNTDDGDDEI